jgi:hypothetical protein
MSGSHRFRWFAGRTWLLFGTLCSLLVLGVAGTTTFPAAHAAGVTVTAPPPTVSLYESTTDSGTLYSQGCSAGHGPSGVVVLDFGEPWYQGGQYGTIDFANSFITDDAILHAAANFAQGAWDCSSSSHNITVAIGTSNYGSNVQYAEGESWGDMVGSVESFITNNKYTSRVGADGAIDAETEWNSASATYNFVVGYNSGIKNQRWMWDYGDDTPGYWTNEQVWDISYGLGNERPLPEIYYNADATQDWLAVAEWACSTGRTMKFEGTMAEAVSGTNTPNQAFDDLYNALGANPCTQKDRESMRYSTVI